MAALLAAPESKPRGSVLLVSGFTGSKEDFITLLPLLRDLGWHVVAIDLPGQYQSVGPDDESAYSLNSWADSVLAAAAELKLATGMPAHLLGHSFGGLVVRNAFLADSPEPEHRLICSVTLLSSGPGALLGRAQTDPLEKLISLLPDTALDEVWKLKEHDDRERGWKPPSQEIHDFLRRRFVANNPYAMRAAARILTTDLPRITELSNALSSRETPALVAYGQHDDAWLPTEQEAMADALGIPQFTFPHTGHSPNTEHPVWCAGALEAFWSQASSQLARVVAGPSDPFGTPWSVNTSETGYTEGMELRIPIEHSPAAVGKARQTLGRMIEAWNLDSVYDDLEIVASEMVTNAIRHGTPPIEFRIITGDGYLRLEVHDGSPQALPEPRDAADDDVGGRGLALIDALSSEWGFEVHANGKVVWVHVATG